jgi:hypothetical protein
MNTQYNRCCKCKRFCKVYTESTLAYSFGNKDYYYKKSVCCNAHVAMRRPSIEIFKLKHKCEFIK